MITKSVLFGIDILKKPTRNAIESVNCSLQFRLVHNIMYYYISIPLKKKLNGKTKIK